MKIKDMLRNKIWIFIPDFKTNEDIKDKKGNFVMQAHEEDYMKAWNLICDVSRKEFQKVYDRLGVKIQVGKFKLSPDSYKRSMADFVLQFRFRN